MVTIVANVAANVRLPRASRGHLLRLVRAKQAPPETAEPCQVSPTQLVVYEERDGGDLHRRDAIPNPETDPCSGPTREYRDKATGKTLDRPGWSKLWADVETGKVDRIVVWRMDRLGRTAAGLTALFEDLQKLRVGFVSIHDKVDLSSASGRLMAHVLASVARYETELRSERIQAGIDAARAEGKTWGGRDAGSRNQATAGKAAAARKLRTAGESVSSIARTVGLSRPTVYSLLG